MGAARRGRHGGNFGREVRRWTRSCWAASLIPDPPNVFSQSGADFFFRQSARTLIVSLLQGVKSREPGDIPKLLALPRAKLREALRGTPAETLIDPGAHEQGAGIVATAFSATNPFRYLTGNAEQSWSAFEWAQSRVGWLFLTSTEDSREAALPLQSVWLDCISAAVDGGAGAARADLDRRRRATRS
jgi:Type IV secretion-system coupling protein DNA-binding domain